MNLTITELKGKSDLNKFVNLPWSIYRNDPHWVPPLKIAIKDLMAPKHPFYETSQCRTFLAMQDGKVLGRIMGIINHEHNKFHQEKCGFFGFFEATNNEKVANALLRKVQDWLLAEGMDIVRGPVNPSTNYECGLLVEGFDDDPQLMMTYNPPFYKKLNEDNGYAKSKDLLAYQIDLNFQMPEKIVKIAERVEKSENVTYRKINMKDWDNEIRLMMDIYNSAWEKNWGFIPMTEKEFLHTAKDLKTVIDPNLIQFCMVKGDPAAFIVALPDYNQVFKRIPNGRLLPTGIFKLLTGKKHINRMRVITMGVKEKYRNLGLASLLYKREKEDALAQGYKECEMSWILEDNFNMNRPLVVMGAKPYKRYRIFEKVLSKKS